MSAVATAPRVSVRRLHWRPVAAQSWLVRSLVIDTSGAMSRRDVLVRPAQVLDEDRPVYLQYDMAGVPRSADPHLRSGEILPALVLDTGVWLPGRRRSVAPREVRAIDWIARTIELG